MKASLLPVNNWGGERGAAAVHNYHREKDRERQRQRQRDREKDIQTEPAPSLLGSDCITQAMVDGIQYSIQASAFLSPEKMSLQHRTCV